MVYKRKKYHRGDTHLQKRWRLRRRRKDLDEIEEDLQSDNQKNLLVQEIDPDKPGCGQFYCIHCARYFIDEFALFSHFRTKVHKRRLKALEYPPHTYKEAEQAAGHGSFQLPQKRKLSTILPEAAKKKQRLLPADVDSVTSQLSECSDLAERSEESDDSLSV